MEYQVDIQLTITVSNCEMSRLLENELYNHNYVHHLHRKNRNLEGCVYLKMNTVVDSRAVGLGIFMSSFLLSCAIQIISGKFRSITSQ